MKMEIMSGSSWLECLFFISCSSWQKASRFCLTFPYRHTHTHTERHSLALSSVPEKHQCSLLEALVSLPMGLYLGAGKDKVSPLAFVLLSLKNNPQFILDTLRLDQLTDWQTDRQTEGQKPRQIEIIVISEVWSICLYKCDISTIYREFHVILLKKSCRRWLAGCTWNVCSMLLTSVMCEGGPVLLAVLNLLHHDQSSSLHIHRQCVLLTFSYLCKLCQVNVQLHLKTSSDVELTNGISGFLLTF